MEDLTASRHKWLKQMGKGAFVLCSLSENADYYDPMPAGAGDSDWGRV